MIIIRHLGYERVYLPLHEVADTPVRIIQGDGIRSEGVFNTLHVGGAFHKKH